MVCNKSGIAEMITSNWVLWTHRSFTEPTPSIINAAIVSVLTKNAKYASFPLRGYLKTVVLCCTVPISCHSIPAPGRWWYVDGQRAKGVNAILMTSVSERIREKRESTPPLVRRIFFSLSFYMKKVLLSVHHLKERAFLLSALIAWWVTLSVPT